MLIKHFYCSFSIISNFITDYPGSAYRAFSIYSPNLFWYPLNLFIIWHGIRFPSKMVLSTFYHFSSIMITCALLDPLINPLHPPNLYSISSDVSRCGAFTSIWKIIKVYFNVSKIMLLLLVRIFIMEWLKQVEKTIPVQE